MYSRLNYLRFFLALTVLVFHANFLAVPLGGTLAVWCFFVISGYLVSDILYGRYRNRSGDFLTNRFLRIYPVYWTSVALGLALVILLPEIGAAGRKGIFLPQNYPQWFSNLTLFGANASNGVRWIVRPAWSLAIEMQWYLILFVGSFLPKRFMLSFFGVVLLIPAFLHFGLGEKILSKGAGYCFALGALAYHLNFRAPRWIQLTALALLPVFLLVLPRYFGFSAYDHTKLGVWLVFVSVPLLLFLCMPWLSKKSEASALSRFAGEISYPLFLIHFYLVSLFRTYTTIPHNSWHLVGVVTVSSLIVSAAIVFLVDRPIARVRTSIRNRQPGSPPPQ